MDKIYDKCCGIDVHKKLIVACFQCGRKQEVREFGATTRELLTLADWLKEGGCEMVAMESTASYWKPLFNILESSDLNAMVVNARHMKAVPGRKTDVKDAEWIADLLQHGLLQPSYIPNKDQRELRELVRYRKSLVGERTRELNRLQKMLEGANIKLSGTVSDINGKRFSETSRIIENDYCNLSVTYEEVKESRKVIGLNFDVVKKDNKEIIEIHNVGPDEMPVFEALSKESQIAYEAFKKWKVPQIVISEAYQKYGADDFYKIYLNVENAIKNGKIKNKGGYAATCLRGGYTFDGETQKTEMEIKQITPEEILETKRLEEKIENLTADEKEKVLEAIIKKYDNGTVTSSIIKNKTFDELKQDMFGKKIIIDVLKNQK